VEIVNDLPASERFFAGGDTSVRGYALDRLGTPETIDRNGFPLGGNAVIVLNAELRVPVWKDLGVVGFVDAGNVFHRVSDFAFGEIRPTTGFGLRYRSPIGPIRVDLGFKLDRQTLPDGSFERLTALHISLGQAF
jgi:outer membrane translocation and assembly module TamA